MTDESWLAPDVVISTETPQPIDDAAFTLEHPLGKRIKPPLESYKHRLVVLGDSLSHGFKSAAIHDTALSWPAQVAGAMGVSGDAFRFPSYAGPSVCPGLPINIEAMLKRLEGGSDASLTGLKLPITVSKALLTAAQIKFYWEIGPGNDRSHTGEYMHNLSIFGWDMRDALDKSVGWCADHIQGSPKKFIEPAPNDAECRAALRVLGSPDGSNATTQVTAMQGLSDEGGIETLVVALGANCALASVVHLTLTWSPDDYETLDTEERLKVKDKFTVWHPAHFKFDYDALVEEVRDADPKHVVLTTVPHVTIAPLLHGFGDKPAGSRYFTRYGRVWLTEQEFDANQDDCLTGDQCRLIDSAIDMYNVVIKNHVIKARSEGLDWHVFDMCGLLDRMAYRRYFEQPVAPHDFDEYELPAALAALSPRPDTRFFGSDDHGRLQGGIVALDGVHPTTIGYGIVAHEVLQVLIRAGAAPTDAAINFAELITKDTLISEPPKTLTDDLKTIGYVMKDLGVIKSLVRI